MKRIDKIIYGSGRLGSSILLQMVGFLIFYLYFEFFLLDPILNGIANAFGKLTIAFSGFFMGYISDKTNTKRWGRRKPYIIIGAPSLAITFIMLFIPHLFGLNIIKFFGISIGNDVPLFIYLLIFVCGFNFFYGFLLVPYQAWMPELSEEHERIEVSAFENLFNVIAAGFATGISFLFPVAFSGEGLAILPYIVLILGLVEIGGYILPFIRLQEDPEKFVAQPELKTELKVVWENKNYMKWMVAQGFFSISFTLIINSVFGFVQNILRYSTMQYIIAALILLLITMVFWKVWSKLSHEKSKHFSLQTALTFFTIVIPFSLIIGLFPVEVFGYIFIGLVAAGISSWYLFPYVILADIAEDDELRTGKKRAGMYSGFSNVPLNIFQAFAMLLSGLIFGFLPNLPIYFTESNIQTIFILNWWRTALPSERVVFAITFLIRGYSFSVPNIVSSGYIWFGPASVIFMVIGLLVFSKVKIDFNLEERRKSRA